MAAIIDALNAGINYSRYELICCIDADCIIEKQAIKKLARIFARKKETIAVSGMVKAFNGCKVKDDQIQEIDLPHKFIEQVQVVEYLRAFLINRFTWNKNNGSLIISGAFGMFSKNALITVGGYYPCLGEDMELIVRLQHHYRQHHLKYAISMTSDAVCWTQIPSSWHDLQTQRVRWHRGLIQSLMRHKSMLLSLRYGKVGMLAFPHQLFIEMLGPLIEMIGYLLMFILLWQHHLAHAAFLVFTMAYLSGVLQSLSAVIFERLTYNVYTSKTHTWQLILICFIEPLFYRPLTVI